jgi:glycosyltransferase involved in cell wall biosynthesis
MWRGRGTRRRSGDGVAVRSVTFAVPGDIATSTGGYAYDRRIIAELRRLGWDVDLLPLGDGFPAPNAAQAVAAQARLLASATDRPVVIDGLAFGVLPAVAAALHGRQPVVALIHHPLACETGLTPERAQQLEDSERRALAAARLVITTSRPTADLLIARFGVLPGRIEVILPGNDRVPLAAGSGGPEVELLSVGAIVPRKGFDLLVGALARLADLPWRLTIAGDRGRDPGAVARLDAAVERHGLHSRIRSLGAVSSDQLAALYARADLFVLASHFEGYGMAYAEAIAHGLPIVGTTGGAIPETVPASAGRLVQPGDVEALARSLREMSGTESHRRELAAGARAAAAALPSWAESGRQFGLALERLV